MRASQRLSPARPTSSARRGSRGLAGLAVWLPDLSRVILPLRQPVVSELSLAALASAQNAGSFKRRVQDDRVPRLPGDDCRCTDRLRGGRLHRCSVGLDRVTALGVGYMLSRGLARSEAIIGKGQTRSDPRGGPLSAAASSRHSRLLPLAITARRRGRGSVPDAS